MWVIRSGFERIPCKKRVIFLTVSPLFMPKSKSFTSLFAHSLFFKEELEQFWYFNTLGKINTIQDLNLWPPASLFDTLQAAPPIHWVVGVEKETQQETWDMWQETWDRRRATGDGRQEMWDKRSETGDLQQELWDVICETGDRKQETGDVRHDTGFTRQETWYRIHYTKDMIQDTLVTETFVSQTCQL